MISAWTTHLKTDEDKERFRTAVRSSSQVLERLSEILSGMEKEMDGKERDVRIYDTPGWDYRIAHLNGFRDCLNKVSKIINLDDQRSS